MACIGEGMKKAGINDVSERYLQMLGVALQGSLDGPRDLTANPDKEIFYTRAVQVIQAYGYCDNNSKNWENASEDAQIQSLINFRHQAGSSIQNGMEYIDNDPKKVKNFLKTNFGIQLSSANEKAKTPFALFPSTAGEWETWSNSPAVRRQKIAEELKMRTKVNDRNSEFEILSCFQNMESRNRPIPHFSSSTTEYDSKNGANAFNLQVLKGGESAVDLANGKPDPYQQPWMFEARSGSNDIGASVKRKYKDAYIQDVQNKSIELCESMAKSCEIGDRQFCRDITSVNKGQRSAPSAGNSNTNK